MEALIKPMCPSIGKIFDIIALGANALGLLGFALVVCMGALLGMAVQFKRKGLHEFVVDLPGTVVTMLIVVAICNLLLGVFLRYVVGWVTYTCDLDNVPFTWVEEVGEMALAWLTLIGAAIGIRARAHFTLHFLTPMLPMSVRRALDVMNHLLIAAIGALTAWYAWDLCRLNWTLKTAGLQISLAALYASAVVGGVLITIYALSMIIAPRPHDPNTSH